jgi:hypothetical protein
MKMDGHKKIANTILLPIVLDVPFAAVIVGFRPSRLPPLPEGSRGIAIQHIQSNHWAERAGLKVGDVITHVNGKPVTHLKSEGEFIDSMRDRPLRITFDIMVSSDEFKEAIGQYDWSSRFDAIKKVELAKSSIGGDTNEVFDSVFGKDVLAGEKSPLFDATEWIGANGTSSKPIGGSDMKQPVFKLVENNAKASVPPVSRSPKQTTIQPTPVALPTVSKRESQKKKTPAATPGALPPPTTFETVTKVVEPTEPIRVHIHIGQGYALPNKAGILQSDHFVQPFSAEPYFELLLADLPDGPDDDTMTLEFILSTPAISGDNTRIETPICDKNQRWNFPTSLTLPSEYTKDTLSRVLLIGRLMDYRRLSQCKPMGVFAVRLNTLDTVATGADAKPKLLSLSVVDPIAFDVTKTRIRSALGVMGKEVEVRTIENVAPKEIVQNEEEEGGDEDDESRSSSPQSLVELHEELHEEHAQPESQAQEKNDPTDQESSTNLTPFQRAYMKARNDARSGDFTSLHQQNYGLRNYE